MVSVNLYTGSVWFASEMKALSYDCERFMTFLPGHIYSSKNGMFFQFRASMQKNKKTDYASAHVKNYFIIFFAHNF